MHLYILWLVLTLAWSVPARAAEVQLVMPNGLQARAEYRAGNPAKPAVLILHGFLQNHQFPTVFRLLENLHSAGHTVLAPTLSLNTPLRQRSLACEAVHTHTVEGDTVEVDTWVRWLARRHNGAIALAGHSTGAMELLSYVSGTPHPAVRRLFAISIVESQTPLDTKRRDALIRELQNKIARKDRSPALHALSYCRKYTAAPASILSHLERTPERILRDAREHANLLTFIMGSRDERLGRNWIPRLQQTGARVRVIEGGDHFMDGEHEFGLADMVLEELKNL
jgi:pimeloyl-ACP methyl ester carboxylesterase